MDQKAALMAEIRQKVAAYCALQSTGFDPADPVVRLHEPTFGAEEINAALECLLTTRVTMGPKVKGFERAFADRHGYPHGVMVNSGSSANLLAIAALVNPETEDRLKPGDEVIVSALSWSTTVWPLVQMGLVPVVVDIDPATFNIDPAAVERAIGPRTRAVMPVHVYGNPCDMDALTALCERRGLILIEDCCEALGAEYDGRAVGSFGRVGTFSFYYSHHITTLEGGICVTGDTPFAETMRILRAHGWLREVENPAPWLERYPGVHPRFLFVNSGFNLRATDIQGAMGPIQLDKLPGFVEVRRSNAAYFRSKLDRYGDFFEFQEETAKGRHSWFGFTVRLRPNAPFAVADLTRHLEERHIETRPIICGNIARQPAMALFEHRVDGGLEHADTMMQKAFSFGNHQSLDDGARDYVVRAIDGFMAGRGLA